MNKNSIKSFAVESRKKLIEDIKYKASLIGITEDNIADPIVKSEGIETFSIHGSGSYSIYDENIIKREKLVHEIEYKGFNNVVEEIAYTWFNRIIAIRFMEVNNYLPTKTRVLSSEIPGKSEPDIITEALDLDLDLSIEDKNKIFELKDENKLDDLFEFLFIKQCNKLNEILPGLFEKTEDYAELLLNISFVKSDGIIQQLISSIPEKDFHNQVEIIGWLYQFYNSELKDEVYEDINKRGVKVSKEGIPAATQLFTPDWIVKYLVENSLGRLWLDSHDDDELKQNWKYYLDEVEQDITVEEDLKILKESYKDISLEEIKIVDPSMGSGHILIYAFDVLMDIYLSEGYSKKDATISIIENNLHGLEIDDRAYQLAYFAVMMKARQYNKTIFKNHVKTNLSSIHESNCINSVLIEKISEESPEIKNELDYLIKLYENAKLYGSILKFDYKNFDSLIETLSSFEETSTLDNLEYSDDLKKLKGLLNQTKLLNLKYDIVVTNPPYMAKGINQDLKKYLSKNYKDSKSDLYAVFIEKGHELLKENGYNAMITQESFMFLKSFENLRKKLLQNNIINMVHLGTRAFEEMGGEVVRTTSFVYRKNYIENFKSLYIRLIDYKTKNKEKEFFNHENYYITSQKFNEIPGSPIAYWADKPLFDAFKNDDLSHYADVNFGLKTGNNDHFIRFWFEVNRIQIDFRYNQSQNKKWVPLNKGGFFRKWYGNHEYVINWQNNGEEVKNFPKSAVVNTSYYFKEFLCWTCISIGDISFRYCPKGFIPDHAVGSVFFKNNEEYIFGLLNSSISNEITNLLSPTVNYNVGDISKIPIIKNNEYKNEIISWVRENIELCKNDWDDYETSWNFKTNPLVRYKNGTLSESFDTWKEHKQDDFDHLKSNEVRLNEIFAEIYSMDVECDVEDKHVSIVRADYEKDIKDLISYAVGCMFGRYSLDNEGLICADDNFNQDNYKTIIPDSDAIIPILDTEYFEDDIVEKFIEFIKITFGKEHLEQNLEFIANALHKSGNTSTDQIRNYFLNDFFKDHSQKYKKRPIYWQFNSGKQKGFRCLIYLHRYNPSTVARIRTDYLHKTQKAIEDNIERCDDIIESNYAKRDDKTKAQKEKNKLIKQLEETRLYDEALAHIANQQIDLDLDDGVKVNYEKFQNIPVETESQKTKNINLLTKI